MKLWRKLAIVSVLFGSAYLRGQTSITTFGSGIVDTFTGYDGTAAPGGWTISSGEVFRGYGTGSGTSGGVYSFGTDATGTDTNRWLGVQFTATAPSDFVTLSKTFTNNTGSAISSLTISYDAFQFRLVSGGRPSFIEVNIDGGTSISALSFAASTTGTTGAQSPISPTPLSVTLTSLSISNGSSFTLNFVGDRGTGSGSAQGIGLDNISVTAGSAIPEPSTYATIAGTTILACAFWLRRRRK